MRIAIVNDLKLAVETLRRLILSQPDFAVVWTAEDGEEAVTRCQADQPDLILMDLLMPKLDGVRATGEIMKTCPCPILIVTSSVSENAAKVFEALGLGACDAVSTPVFGGNGRIEGGSEVIRKIRQLARLMNQPPQPAPATPLQVKASPGQQPRMVAIGSSTGGPRALVQVISGLPRDLDAAVVIVQHLDAQFAGSLTEWISQETGWEVTLAGSGRIPQVGKVFLAGTNDHLIVGPDGQFHYREEPIDYPYRPSVDEFFFSIGKHWPSRGVGVLLTGMGRDGARGLLALRQAGWHTIAQDEASSVIFGMPKAAIDLSAAVEIAPLGGIAASIVRKVRAACL
jgi:two-component system response regulator WspF